MIAPREKSPVVAERDAAMPPWLWDRLGEFPEHPAMVWQDREIRYSELRTAIDTWRARFDEWDNLGAGESVGLFGDCSPGLQCALLLALIVNRNIITPLGSMDGGQRDRYLEIARAQAVFEFQSDDVWTFSSARVRHPAPADRECPARRKRGGLDPLHFRFDGRTQGLAAERGSAPGKIRAAPPCLSDVDLPEAGSHRRDQAHVFSHAVPWQEP